MSKSPSREDYAQKFAASLDQPSTLNDDTVPELALVDGAMNKLRADVAAEIAIEHGKEIEQLEHQYQQTLAQKEAEFNVRTAEEIQKAVDEVKSSYGDHVAIVKLDPEEIDITNSRIHTREEGDEWEALKSSMQGVGRNVQPILAIVHPDENSQYKYLIVTGSRRTSAAREVECTLYGAILDPKTDMDLEHEYKMLQDGLISHDAFMAQVELKRMSLMNAENVGRKDESPLETAYHFKKFYALHAQVGTVTKRTVAKLMGVSETTFSRYLNVAAIPPSFLEFLNVKVGNELRLALLEKIGVRSFALTEPDYTKSAGTLSVDDFHAFSREIIKEIELSDFYINNLKSSSKAVEKSKLKLLEDCLDLMQNSLKYKEELSASNFVKKAIALQQKTAPPSPISEIKGFKNQKVISRKSGESVLSVSIEQGVPVLRFKKDHMPQLPPDTVQKILQLVAQSHEDFSLAESPKNDQPDENTDEGA